MPKRPLTKRQKLLKYLLITYVVVLLSFVIASINAVASETNSTNAKFSSESVYIYAKPQVDVKTGYVWN